MRPGGVSQGLEQERRELDHRRTRYEHVRREHVRLRREAARRRRLADQADRKRSKRGIAPKDHDAKEKTDRARITGRDAVAGRLLRQMNGRLERIRGEQESFHTEKARDPGIWITGERSRRDALFRFDPARIALGTGTALAVPELFMLPDDRVAVTGPNGSGKSTLIHRIAGSLELPEERVIYIPQEIHLDAARRILEQVRSLPHDRLGVAMTTVSQLGSRPERILETETPSPGEMRKILLALGIARTPHIIIMDEPTNHMDLPSIQCLEEALAPCPCGLLLVSHDERFLNRLTRIRWEISRSRGNHAEPAFTQAEGARRETTTTGPETYLLRIRRA
jgi:ATPase subunit of ABC transporter with duplicated ATPase domains